MRRIQWGCRQGWVEGMGVCGSVHLNINFKHLNQDTSRVPPRKAQLATLDQACHRSFRIKEEEETHQLFNKRVASLVYHLSHFPSAHAGCRLPAQQSPRIKNDSSRQSSMKISGSYVKEKPEAEVCLFAFLQLQSYCLYFGNQALFNAQQLWLN